MPPRFAAAWLLPLLLAAALLPGCSSAHDQATAAPPASAPPPAAPADDDLPPLEYGYGSGRAAALQQLQQMIELPFGTPVPADTSHVVVCFEVRSWGATTQVQVLRGLSPAVDSAVVAAVYRLPFRSGRSAYEDSIAHPYVFTIRAPGAATAVQRLEATTRWQRTAVRRPGEADTTFVRRVLPRSYALPDEYNYLHALAWRPSPYGRQLVFTTSSVEPRYDNNGSRDWSATDVFVLDPFRPRTYAVQKFHLENIGDLSGQQADAFVADVNADGRPDLVTLLTYSQSVSGGEGMPAGHFNYYRVEVYRPAGLDATGRPRYRLDPTPYPYLEYRQNETPGPYPQEFTPATVRRMLARHLRRLRQRPVAPLPGSTSPDTPKKAGAASPPESDPGQ